MHTKTCYVIKRREMEGKGPKNRVKNRKNGILGGKPTFFFEKNADAENLGMESQLGIKLEMRY